MSSICPPPGPAGPAVHRTIFQPRGERRRLVGVTLAAVLTGCPVTTAHEAADGADTTQALVLKARAGDRDAFSDLVDLHARAARRVAAAALADAGDADDVVQDACLVAWRRLHELDDPGAFRPWLLRIAWRKAIDRRRAGQSWVGRLLRIDFAADDLGAADPAPTPEHQAIAGQLDAAIARAVRSLPVRYRDPFLLAAAQDQQYRDIAHVLGVPIGTVKWRISEARRLLRTKLAALGHEVDRA